jgi:hypothetical protein
MRHPDTISKRRETSLRRHGDESWNNSHQRMNTTAARHGFRSAFEVDAVREKSSRTLLERYGVTHNSSLRKKNFSRSQLQELYHGSGLSCSEIGTVLGVKRTCIERYMHLNEIELDKSRVESRYERKIRDLLSSIGVEYSTNDRTIISPKELDIYVGSNKLAIEVNGAYWHSGDEFKFYHRDKFFKCRELGIRLLQPYDYEIDENFDKIKSIITSSLGRNSRIWARECEIEVLDKRVASNFLEENHVQGSVGHSLAVGLLHKKSLVSVMTVGRPRFNKRFDLELLRLASAIGTTVVGGPAKMMSEISKRVSGSMISYCDRRFFTGAVYETLGFSLIKETSPSYQYFNSTTGDRASRYSCQKHKLKNSLPNFDEDKTEVENMIAAGYTRLWDAGHAAYGKII